MVHILITGRFPPIQSDEAIKATLATNKPKYPDFVKKIHSWGTLPEDGEYKAYTVYECPDEKLYEGINAIMKRYHFYVTAVEDYEYNLEILIPEEDSMKILAKK